MPKKRTAAIVLALAMAAPVGGIAVWSLQRTARDLLDPCTSWESQPQHSLHVDPGAPCQSGAIIGESRAQAVTIALLVPGGVLAAAIVGIGGAIRRRRKLLFGAGLLMVAETFVVFSIAPLTLLTGAAFITAGALLHDPT